MSQLSDKILSYSPEIYRKLSATTVTTTSATNLGSVVTTYSLPGVAGNTTWNADSPIGSGDGCWNLNQITPSQLSNGVTFTGTNLAGLYSDRDTYQGMWFKYATTITSVQAMRMMTSAAGTVGTNSGFSVIPFARTGGGFTLRMSVSNGSVFIGVIGTTLINDGNWHYVAVRRYDNIFDMFIDGELQGTLTGTLANSSIAVNFGNGSGFNQVAHNLRISDLHVGSTTNFPATAPMEIYTAGSTAPNTSAPVRYWNGTAWITSSAQKVYNGTAWVDWNKRYYNGTSWVQIWSWYN